MAIVKAIHAGGGNCSYISLVLGLINTDYTTFTLQAPGPDVGDREIEMERR